MKTITVYCAAKLGNDPTFAHEAREFAKYLVQQNIDIVYGGSKLGIMGVIAETTIENGGKIHGVMPQFLVDKEIANPNITELIITETMSQRKYKMMDLADGFIALPGGFGTLEEIFEVLTLAQVNQLKKPIGFLNINNYYTPLLTFLENCLQSGLLAQKHFNIINIDSDYERLLLKMRNYKK